MKQPSKVQIWKMLGFAVILGSGFAMLSLVAFLFLALDLV